MKATTIAAIVIVVVVVIGGIGAYFLTAAPAKPELKVAMAFSGLIGDPGFPRLGYAALTYIEDTYGAEIAYHERTAYPDIERVLSDYAAEGYTLVWGHGGEYDEGASKVADMYPDTYFITTACITPKSNLIAYDVAWGEATYMAGVVAGLTTQSDKIGVVIGAEFPPIIYLVKSMMLGARSVNPDVQFFVSNVESWIDAPKGKEFALAQIESGADVIFTWADLSAEGAIDACSEEGVYYIAETQDHLERTPTEISLGNIDVNFTPCVADAVDKILAGNFVGETITMGLDEQVVDYTPSSNVSQSVQSQIDTIRAQIIGGTISVPYDIEKTW